MYLRRGCLYKPSVLLPALPSTPAGSSGLLHRQPLWPVPGLTQGLLLQAAWMYHSVSFLNRPAFFPARFLHLPAAFCRLRAVFPRPVSAFWLLPAFRWFRLKSYRLSYLFSFHLSVLPRSFPRCPRPLRLLRRPGVQNTAG